MNRREFSAGAACVLAAAGLGLPRPGLGAEQARGRHATTRRWTSACPIEAPAGKIEVVEFFWYSCPHCNAFEPQLEAWVKKLPADVSFRRVPVAFRDDFVPQQRLFYTLEAMGKVDELHRKVFDAIHVDKQAINKEDPILAWAEKNGLDKAKFKEMYNSFSVSDQGAPGHAAAGRVPGRRRAGLGIAGRWYTDGRMAGNMAARAAGHRLPGRRGPQVALTPAPSRQARQARFGGLFLRPPRSTATMRQQDSCLYETHFLLLARARPVARPGRWPGQAEKADRDKPMNVEADALRYDDLKQTSVFTGNVVVLTKGTIVIRGARIDVRQDPEGYQYGVVTAEPGKLAFFRQKREGVDECIEGEAEVIEYDGKADHVKFIRQRRDAPPARRHA